MPQIATLRPRGPLRPIRQCNVNAPAEHWPSQCHTLRPISPLPPGRTLAGPEVAHVSAPFDIATPPPPKNDKFQTPCRSCDPAMELGNPEIKAAFALMKLAGGFKEACAAQSRPPSCVPFAFSKRSHSSAARGAISSPSIFYDGPRDELGVRGRSSRLSGCRPLPTAACWVARVSLRLQ